MIKLSAAALLVLAITPPLHAQAGSATGGFLLRRGDDTLSVERAARAGSVVEGQILSRRRTTLNFRAAVGADATLGRLELQVRQGGARDAAPRQVVVALVHGDSITEESRNGDSVRVERTRVRRGTLVYHPHFPMVSLLEQIVMRARVLGGARVQLPVYLLASAGRTVDATVELRGDSARVTLGNTEAHLAVDRAGPVLGGRAQGDQAIERLAAVPDRLLARQAPDYSAPADAPYTAREVWIETAAGHTLAGTLTMPRNATGPVPAVVTITGSSAHDRDNNTQYGGPYRIFRQVADTLGRRGIAVLRMDDRGVGESTGDFASATTAERADDIRAGIAYLRTLREVDAGRVGLVGLSEGALIAPMIAATDTTLRGIVLLAGPASTGREIMEYQLSYGIEQSASIAAGQRDSVYRAEAAKLEARIPAEPWLRYFMSYDPLPTAARVRRVPVLILHGTTDRNVPPADAQELAAAFRRAGNEAVTVRMFDGFNHIFLRDPDGNPRRYEALPSFVVGPEVLGAIADWTAAHLTR
jgi:dienelactone hydrolase